MYGSSVLLPLISLSLPRSLSALLYSCFVLSQPFSSLFSLLLLKKKRIRKSQGKAKEKARKD
jgi:hypothetical protein